MKTTKTYCRWLICLTLAGACFINVHAAPTVAKGFVQREVFTNLPGATVPDLTGSAKFIGNQPDAVSLLGSFEAPRRSGGQYGQRVSGWLVPPTTGAYWFFIASDNDSELWLSRDANPANLQFIAFVTGFTASREWNKYPATQNSYAPVTLQAGQLYYLEALMKEEGDEDNLAVGWTLPGQAVDPISDPPVGLENIVVIPGSALGALVEANNSSVTITAGPANATSSIGGHASFSVQAAGSSDLGPFLLYQWKRNGTDIAGANAAGYITPELTVGDDGALFSCVVSVPGKSVTSAEATLTVQAQQSGQPPPVRIETDPPGPNVTVSWDSTDPGISLESVESLGGAESWSEVLESPVYVGNAASVELAATDPQRIFRLKGGAAIGGAAESLFPASSAPNAETNGAPGLELGTIFSSKVPGVIRAVRVYSFAGETGKRVARIWRNNDNTVVAGPFDVPGVGITGWLELDLPQPLSIEADVAYTVSVSTADDPNKVYPVSADFFAAAGGNDKSLTFPAGAGVFSPELGTRPTQTLENSFYFRDVVFVPGSVPPENIITWALNLPVRLGRGGDTFDRELGTVFRSSVAGSITAIRVLSTKQEGGAHTATIWRNSDATVIAGPYTLNYGCYGQLCGDEWVVYDLETPLEIQANTDYTVSVSTGADVNRAYPFLNQAFAAAGGNGKHLTSPVGAGVFGGLGGRPAQIDAASPSYLRDIVFVPAGSTEGESLTDGGAVYPGKLTASHELGTIFQSSVAGTITGIRVYSLNVESGVHQARLWRNSDNALVGGPYDLTYGGTTGWRVFPLPAPLTLEPNVLYTVAVSTGEDASRAYPFVPDGFISADSNTKHLSYPAMAGVLTTAIGTRPTQAPNGNSYLRDIVFQPASEGTLITIGNTTDGTQADWITSGVNGSAAYINGNPYTVEADATLTRIKAKIGSVAGEFKCAIYSDLNGLGDRLLAISEPKSNTTTGWNEFPLTAPLKVKAGEVIWLVIWSNDSNATVYYLQVPSDARLRWSLAPYAPDWPDPIVMETNGNDTFAYCLYAEGTLD